MTRGLKWTVKELRVEICGWETVTSHSSGLKYGFQLNTGPSNIQHIPYSDYQNLFRVNSINCPIVGYDIYVYDGYKYVEYMHEDINIQ